MDEIFRYVAIRPPQHRLPLFTLRIPLDPSPLIFDLRSARSAERPRETMVEVAQTFLDSDDFVSDVENLSLNAPLGQFEAQAKAEAQIGRDQLRQLLATATGASADVLAERQDFIDQRRRVTDSIVALMVLSSGHPTLLSNLCDYARLIDLVVRLARNEEELDIPGAVAGVLTEAIILPEDFLPLPPPTPLGLLAPQPELEPSPNPLSELRERESQIRLTIRSLLSLPPSAFQLSPPEEPLRPSGAPVPVGSPSIATSLRNRIGTLVTSRPRLVATDTTVRSDTSAVRRLMRPEAVERLAADSRDLLNGLRLDPTVLPVTAVVRNLESEMTLLSEQVAALEPLSGTTSFVRLGSNLVPVSPFSPIAGLGFTTPEDSGIPDSVGSVRPAGIGDLLLVRQHIVSYEAGEMAHVENAMRGESRHRSTRRLNRREEIFTLETESTTEQERDLMSTDRRELQEETTKTVQQDQSFNAGVSVSAGYGPFFQVTANTEFASSTSTTESARKAFTIAKEATDRTIARLSERVRRQQTTQTLEEFEETNEHGLDNTGGLDHAIGQYQWLVRRFQAQIYNYGLRLLFNFMVPEPSVFLHRAVAAGAPEGETITAPEPFHIRPNQITEGNYGRYVRDYEVTGVSPPPPLFQTLSRHANDRAEVPGADFAWGEVVTIPPGYRAWEGHATVTFIRWSTMDGSLDGEPIDETTPVIYVNIGREWWRRHTGDSHTHTFVLDDEQLQIPVSVATLWCASYTANIEILCRRDERLFEEWQIETHTAILQSYQKLQTEYEEKLAAATVQQGIRIEGRNPLENRLIERAELKKHCISLVTAQHFDKFSAILESPSSLPRIDFEEAEAEGRYIRFFEQAFEWENMTYVFYPYFWGRRSTWIDRMNLRDTDPVHAEFLKAGAARVVAPVRPGFEQAVLHFLDTGRIWAGGDLPQIGNPLYVDILDEIRERLQSPGQEVAVFEPWEVRMPTTLVRLAPGSTLPRWEQDEEGNWQPVEPSEEG